MVKTKFALILNPDTILVNIPYIFRLAQTKLKILVCWDPIFKQEKQKNLKIIIILYL